MIQNFTITPLVFRCLPYALATRLQPLTQRIDQMLTANNEQASAQRSSLIAFAIRIFSAALALLSQVVLARLMGAHEFGIYVIVWISVLTLGDLACVGFHTTIIRYIPQYLLSDEKDNHRGILRTGAIFSFVSASLIALSGIAIIMAFSDRFESYYLQPFAIGLLCIPVLALANVLDGSARSHGWILSALSPAYVIRPLLMLIIMLALVLLADWPASATTAISAALISAVLTVLPQHLLLHKKIRRRLPHGPRNYHFVEWFKVSLPIFFIEGFFFLLINIDVLMVGLLRQPDDVALYYATVKVLALAHFVYFAVKSSVAQRYSQLLHQSKLSGDPLPLEIFARNSAQWTFWPSLFLCIVILILGWPLLALFGSSYTQGYPLLFILVIGVIARASVGPCESLLSMTGNQNICAMLYAGALVINITLNIILIPLFGLTGAAMATVFAMISEAAMLSLAAYYRLGIAMFVFAPSSRSRQLQEKG